MTACNSQSLDRMVINEEAETALGNGLISKEEYTAIKNAHPTGLYTPNVFIRIGLLLLTVVITLMSALLFGLLVSFSSEKWWGVFAAGLSILLYAALEFVIRKKKHYRSGLDDALLWLSVCFMILAVYLLSPYISTLGFSILVFTLTTYATLRFADALMSGAVFISFLAVIFYSVILLGDMAKSIMPFLLMTVSFLLYRLFRKMGNRARLRHYRSCCMVTETLALFTLYASVNFFVVREVSNAMFDLHLKAGSSIAGGWFFWSATVLIPLLYIFRGIQRKDVILLRTGLILVAATVFTIRHYHQIAPLEISMTVAGSALICLAYWITKYLKIPKHGITHKEPNDPQLPGISQLEALILSQTFHQAPASTSGRHTGFGGGSGGGGGTSGNY